MTRTTVLAGAAAALAIAALAVFLASRPAGFPADFPYTWLAAGTTTTDPAAVLVVRSGSPEEAFGDQAAVLRPAYACDDPACPGRDAQGRPLLFPYALAADGTTVFSACPACAPRRRAAGDLPAMIRPYLTDEGERLLKRHVASR